MERSNICRWGSKADKCEVFLLNPASKLLLIGCVAQRLLLWSFWALGLIDIVNTSMLRHHFDLCCWFCCCDKMLAAVLFASWMTRSWFGWKFLFFFLIFRLYFWILFFELPVPFPWGDRNMCKCITLQTSFKRKATIAHIPIMKSFSDHDFSFYRTFFPLLIFLHKEK